MLMSLWTRSVSMAQVTVRVDGSRSISFPISQYRNDPKGLLITLSGEVLADDQIEQGSIVVGLERRGVLYPPSFLLNFPKLVAAQTFDPIIHDVLRHGSPPRTHSMSVSSVMKITDPRGVTEYFELSMEDIGFVKQLQKSAAKSLSLDMHQIADVFDNFADENGLLSFSSFIDCLIHLGLFPQPESQNSDDPVSSKLEKLFTSLWSLLDKDPSELVDSSEFFSGITLFAIGDFGEKLKSTFFVMDADGDGQIDRNELFTFFKSYLSILYACRLDLHQEIRDDVQRLIRTIARNSAVFVFDVCLCLSMT